MHRLTWRAGLLIFALAAGGPRAQANIGETLPELRGRYGSAKDMGGQMLFEVRLVDGQLRPARGATDSKSHYSVTVYFDGDHSAMEIFTRNTTDPGKSDMPDADIQNFLASESDGQTWNLGVGPSGKPTWIRSDQKLIARLSAGREGDADSAPVLIVMMNSK